MTNELMTTPVKFEVNGQEVKLSGNTVRQYLVSGNGNVTDQEVVMFMNLCKFQKLNPFLNEAYLIKFGNSPAQIIVGKEAFLKRAESIPGYKGFKAGIVVERNGDIKEIEGAIKLKNDELLGGWAEVYREGREPYKVVLSIDEFGKNQSTWKSMPLNMIRKTAIVNALREAFPENLGAMYTEEERKIEAFDIKEEIETENATVVVNEDIFKPKEEVEYVDAEIIQSEFDLNDN